TSLERIAPASLTPPHVLLRSPQHLAWSPSDGTRSSLTGLHKRRFDGDFLKILRGSESNQKVTRVNWIPGACHSGMAREHQTRNLEIPGSMLRIAPERHSDYCVLATRGGIGWLMNWVASSIAGPSGVGTFSQNGTRTRVPATGANAISTLRWAARYLITGRSGI